MGLSTTAKERTVNNKPRRPWLAALLTIFQTGLGHLYAGSPKRGIGLLVIGQLLFLAFAISLTVIFPSKAYLYFAAGVSVAFTLLCVVDAIFIAKKKKDHYEPAKYNSWYIYIGYIVISSLLVQLYMSVIVVPYFVQTFKMPTGSMEPTLLVGDRLLVNKRIYKTVEPRRGDVIVHRYPLRPEVAYVKRLIGEPGDKVEMIGRTVYINDAPLKEAYTQYLDPGSVHEHFGPSSIPPGNYFVMGDNRDSSQDSRHWGYVPKEYLLGKPLIIYWSFQTGRDEYLQTSMSDRLMQSLDRLLHFTGKTRWNRVLQVIE
jgi:signal peptidase I